MCKFLYNFASLSRQPEMLFDPDKLVDVFDQLLLFMWLFRFKYARASLVFFSSSSFVTSKALHITALRQMKILSLCAGVNLTA